MENHGRHVPGTMLSTGCAVVALTVWPTPRHDDGSDLTFGQILERMLRERDGKMWPGSMLPFAIHTGTHHVLDGTSTHYRLRLRQSLEESS